MSNIILVHGMSATGLSWGTIPKILTDSGHSVSNVTLPGHGNVFEYLSTELKDYVSAVADHITKDEPYTLIGHSMGGFVISQTAAEHKLKINRLVYLAAMMPSEGDTIARLAAQSGTTYKKIKKEFDEANVGPGALGLQPLGPLDDPFSGAGAISEIPRDYIRCSNDSIISPTFSDAMIANWTDTVLHDLNSGHLPQYTIPDELGSTLLSIVS